MDSRKTLAYCSLIDRRLRGERKVVLNLILGKAKFGFDRGE